MKDNSNLNVSEFKNNVVAKKSKIFFYSLIDYFCCLILSFVFLVGVANPIATACSGYQETTTLVAENLATLNEIVSSTRLMRVDDSSSLEDISVLTEEYITTLVKTSCYVYGIDYEDDEVPSIEETFLYTYDEANDLEYPNDSLLYYYLVFKVEHEDLNSYVYDNVDRSDSDLDDYFYKSILQFNTSSMESYFITNTDYHNLDEELQNNLSRFNILTRTHTTNLRNYLVQGDSSSTTVTNAYTYLSNCYQNATQFFIDEVESSYSVYIEARDIYNINYSYFALDNIYAMLAAYVAAFLILFVILPIFLKSHRTIGQKVMKLGFCRLDEMEPTALNLTLYYISTFIWFFSSQLFVAWFLGNLGVLSFGLFGSSFNVFQIIMFALLVQVLSYIFLAFNKNHQTISLLLSQMVVKKTDEFEKGVAEEDIKFDGTVESEIKEVEYNLIGEIEIESNSENVINESNEGEVENTKENKPEIADHEGNNIEDE